MINDNFQIIAYATDKSPYVHELVELGDSCRKYGYKPFFKVVGDHGSWQRNTQAKAQFIMLASMMYAGFPIVYLDADARIAGRLDLLEHTDADFAAHWFRDRELISACLYFKNDSLGWTDRIIHKWIDENEKYPDVWDQKNLQTVVKRLEPQGLNVLRLPPEYNWIDAGDPNRTPDLSERHYGRRQPRIIQTQASRRYKKPGLVA